jgi:uncharacterized protein
MPWDLASFTGLKNASSQMNTRNDHRLTLYGVNPTSTDPQPTAAMARRLHCLLEAAKQDGNIEPPVRFLHERVDRTIANFCDKQIACKKGCAHCCYTPWVSASAPEVLFIAKMIKQSVPDAVGRVKAANLETKSHDFNARARVANACPLLEQDSCSIYEFRPRSCRLGASADANACARAFRHFTEEKIPIPVSYLKTRNVYAVALAVALRRSDLPHYSYELNAALLRAFSTDNAERDWLSGKDIFYDVSRDRHDLFSIPQAQMMFERAFE